MMALLSLWNPSSPLLFRLLQGVYGPTQLCIHVYLLYEMHDLKKIVLNLATQKQLDHIFSKWNGEDNKEK